MPLPKLLVTLKANAEARAVIAGSIGAAGQLVYLQDCAPHERVSALRSATVVLSRQIAAELHEGEAAHLAQASLIQFVTAGVDYIPLNTLPDRVPVAGNGGAYSEPMAEHALAMTLAAMKRLAIEQAKLAAGTFDQFRSNRMLSGSVCGILGFGGIGAATARLMQAFGARVHALNRSGTTSEPVDWIGKTEDLDQMLAASDVLLLSLPLTPASQGLIGRRELGLMKPDAILVNLARGEIVDEDALYVHLQANPHFIACIDAWWIEPVRHGRFAMGHPFLDLPNVIGSPHNSASVAAWRDIALQRACDNARRALEGATPHNLVSPQDRMM